MIQSSLAANESRQTLDDSCPSIWGLSVSQLHDAYWRSCGVQCVRRGQMQKLQAGTDLFLLIEPDQLVLFDLHEMAERLAWRAAAITRLRVIGHGDDSYGEHVEIDEHDRVRRITRRYRPQAHATYRVLLTRRRRIAKAWMSGEVRRQTWLRIRRMVGASNINTWHCPGGCFTPGRPTDEAQLLDRLVQTWKSPGRALTGLQQVREGVWTVRNAVVHDDAIVIGPAWIGCGHADLRDLCVVGPAWISDVSSASARDELAIVRVRDIEEIDPADVDRDESAAPKTRPGYAFAKRLLDISASAAGLLLLSPVFLAIGACILVEEGWPLFFSQRRQTRGGKIFRCWKFRTMCRNADLIKQQIAAQNVCDGPQFYIQNDPRVTKVGRVLRKYYLDELPQLWNVLIGQMSLVGPRPSPDQENQICPAWRELRLSVRPGLTGLWQLERTRLPGTDFQEWIRFDLEYIERASFWFDVQLLLRTVQAVLFGKRPADSDDQRE
jgi:lipopolysaccharide/colanic/teichoic acid biosynthesis glycosyltransferase